MTERTVREVFGPIGADRFNLGERGDKTLDELSAEDYDTLIEGTTIIRAGVEAVEDDLTNE